jgi:hypothetical protein
MLRLQARRSPFGVRNRREGDGKFRLKDSDTARCSEHGSGELQGVGVVQSLPFRRVSDRYHCHSGIFFSYAKIFGPFGISYQRASSDLDITLLARQQNHNELSVLSVFGRIG